MKYHFNQQAAIWTFCAVVMVFVISVGVARFQNGKEIPLIGALVYGILGIFASIISGLMVPMKKYKLPESNIWDELNKKEDKKNARKKKTGKTKKS